MRRFRATVALTIITALPGCDRDPLTGPPDIRLGRDECAECGMMINEDRCSSALLIDADGERCHALFDDIGCMADYEHEKQNEMTVVGRFVHDYNTRAWADAVAASILFADPEKIVTPMGSGIIALSDHTSAETLRSSVGGEVIDFEGVAAARRKWRAARFGGSAEPRPENPR